MLQNVYSLVWDLRISGNSEIPCEHSPLAELLSLIFFNTNSATQCVMYNLNVSTKSAFDYENNSEYTLT